MTIDGKRTREAKIPKQTAGRNRVAIEGVAPEIDCGEFPIKRIVGETVTVEADVFADGHDAVSGRLLYRGPKEHTWRSAPLSPLANDRWRAEFVVSDMGQYKYTLEAWIDPFETWRKDMAKRMEAGQDVHVELMAGGALVQAAAKRAKGKDAKRLVELARLLADATDIDAARAAALDTALPGLMRTYSKSSFVTRYEKELRVVVDRERAGFSSWYELFPRSCSLTQGEHGTFRDCEARLPYVAAMGFNVLYFPPIHPIGRSFRKGKNNAPEAQPGEVGSPWAIGSEQGGHKSILSELGTLEDFHSLVAKAKDFGLEIALDLAYQCSPDHPYVQEHPEFFRKRADGSIQYAENPPKKYQDIYPLDFETENWRELWIELKSVIDYWIAQGIYIFRVDNPHTKAFPFWEWVIGEVKVAHPQVLFLAEAFTRPKVMYRLAKLGFSWSYTYFTWRTTKAELTEYFEELTQTEIREYFRPNLWPNTPDILHETLQRGGRPAFTNRLVLAATLGANYGIYGPAFESMEHLPKEEGSEEYLNSEKYELKNWDLTSSSNLRDFIQRVNAIRNGHAALHVDRYLHFHSIADPFLLCYSKCTRDLDDVILVIVNLHAEETRAGWVDLDLAAVGQQGAGRFTVHDLLTDTKYSWQGSRNFVQLGPGQAHIFHVMKL